MMQKQNDGHIFVSDTEIADAEFQCKVTANDLLLDLKVLMKEYYVATFSEDSGSLKIALNNGQKFHLILLEDSVHINAI